MHTAATDGTDGSTGFGRTALAHIATILPTVSEPSSVVRSMDRIARSRAHSLESRLIERLDNEAARSSSPNSHGPWRPPPHGGVGRSASVTTATQSIRRSPAAIAAATAFRSAQTDTGQAAFSTFTPVKTRPPARMAAPTWNSLYGAYALVRTSAAAATSSWICCSGGLLSGGLRRARLLCIFRLARDQHLGDAAP